MIFNRPMVVSIAGFDPSGGAGILADIKTFEQLRAYGLGVLTANTFQTDTEVRQVNWIPLSQIKEQLGVLLNRWEIEWFKIGIIESSEVLLEVIQFIKSKCADPKFVWDPVLRSSTGYLFFNNGHTIVTLLKYITVFTPNLPEFEALVGTEERAISLSDKTIIYLKGGHKQQAELGKDILFYKGVKQLFNPATYGSAKHGSGCVLSAAICVNFALKIPVPLAFEKSKRYIEQYLTSNPSLLGYHTSP